MVPHTKTSVDRYHLFSVDDHVVEPADTWTRRVPTRYRDEAPHVVEREGRQYWHYEDTEILTMGLNAVAGKPRETWATEPARFDDMIPGCFDPVARSRDLLSQGVLASISFPTLPRFGGMLFPTFKDKTLADLCVRAWNDFILDEWCTSGPPGLFVPMTICQVWDPKLAAEEIARCIDRGTRSLCFVENPAPSGLPSFHDPDHWDPIWSVCQEAGLPISMHIASSGWRPVADAKAPHVGLIAVSEASAMLSMSNLLFSPVLQNFPGLKIVWSEAGIGWIPAFLDRADRQVERHVGWAGERTLRPSELFERNMWCCMVEEPRAIKHWPELGSNKILAESDYPHADSTFPFVQESLDEVFDGIPRDVTDAVCHGNAEVLFNWKMADASLLDDPEIVLWRSELSRDPFAAMRLRHNVGGISTESRDSTGRCTHLVINYNQMVECGAEVVEGACLNGHPAMHK